MSKLSAWIICGYLNGLPFKAFHKLLTSHIFSFLHNLCVCTSAYIHTYIKYLYLCGHQCMFKCTLSICLLWLHFIQLHIMVTHGSRGCNCCLQEASHWGWWGTWWSWAPGSPWNRRALRLLVTRSSPRRQWWLTHWVGLGSQTGRCCEFWNAPVESDSPDERTRMSFTNACAEVRWRVQMMLLNSLTLRVLRSSLSLWKANATDWVYHSPVSRSPLTTLPICMSNPHPVKQYRYIYENNLGGFTKVNRCSSAFNWPVKIP